MNELLPHVEIEFELTNAENAAALRWHVLHTGGFRLTAPAGVLAAALLTAAMRFNDFSWLYAIGVGALALVGSALLVVFVFPWIAAVRSPQLTQHYHFIFSQRNIRYESEETRGVIEWDRYDRWTTTPDFYLLYYEGEQFTVIPRRAYPSEEAEKRFVKMLQLRLG